MNIAGPRPVVVQATGWTLIAIAAGAIMARLYLRLKIQRRRLLASDMFICGAWVAGVAITSLNVLLQQLGALEPSVKTNMEGFKGDPEDIPKIFKIFWLGNVPLWSAFYLSQAALLSMYLQIFPKFMVKRRIFLWATIAYVVTAYVASILMLFLICIPVEKNWDMDPHSTCPPVRGYNVFLVGWALHLVGDLLVFTLPWLVVTGLNLRMTLKIGVYCTFLLGLINIVFDVLRFVPIQASQVGNSASISLIALWGILDVNIGIVIACLPALRPYFNNSESSQRGSSNSEAKSWGSSVPPGAVRTVGCVGSNPRHNTNGPEDNWDGKRKSNGSEVELFQRNSGAAEIA
ncbi:hypothetical protein BGZ61DRAFT_452838 [Ilyonectria robusta]|uniref:uncharacterized protein n=1 Tax=Ilyonectria robusta TaxID=1079257 RepID=UPI001E8E03C8|nr:uncharacterized protein BGZ61DRAFT_452838 [Ilyonectria robusta]KAH8688153.1 hypothetical protein BGZ61DRAFT_452838 [Ilyonectria robusta]